MDAEAVAVETMVTVLNNAVVQVSQILAILVIAIGMVKAVLIFFRDALFGKETAAAIRESRGELGHSFSLGLGFLIGASILKTAIAPTWDDIGKLTAIIAIRTALNYFLLRGIDDGTITPPSATDDSAKTSATE